MNKERKKQSPGQWRVCRTGKPGREICQYVKAAIKIRAQRRCEAMRRETKPYKIRPAEIDDFESTPPYFNMPLLIEFNGKKQVLGAGKSDDLVVFRYDKDRLAVLSLNEGHGYAGLQVVDFEELDPACRNEVFFQDVNEELADDLHNIQKDFFCYSAPWQADMLAQFLDN